MQLLLSRQQVGLSADVPPWGPYTPDPRHAAGSRTWWSQDVDHHSSTRCDRVEHRNVKLTPSNYCGQAAESLSASDSQSSFTASNLSFRLTCTPGCSNSRPPWCHSLSITNDCAAHTNRNPATLLPFNVLTYPQHHWQCACSCAATASSSFPSIHSAWRGDHRLHYPVHHLA